MCQIDVFSACCCLPRVCRCCIMARSIRESARVTQPITDAWDHPREKKKNKTKKRTRLHCCSNSSRQKRHRRNFLHLLPAPRLHRRWTTLASFPFQSAKGGGGGILPKGDISLKPQQLRTHQKDHLLVIVLTTASIYWWGHRDLFKWLPQSVSRYHPSMFC